MKEPDGMMGGLQKRSMEREVGVPRWWLAMGTEPKPPCDIERADLQFRPESVVPPPQAASHNSTHLLLFVMLLIQTHPSAYLYRPFSCILVSVLFRSHYFGKLFAPLSSDYARATTFHALKDPRPYTDQQE